jgi:phosphatidylserine/phosphatidylglycerophosphate/cardiolipin synthase-like enzyme
MLDLGFAFRQNNFFPFGGWPFRFRCHLNRADLAVSLSAIRHVVSLFYRINRHRWCLGGTSTEFEPESIIHGAFVSRSARPTPSISPLCTGLIVRTIAEARQRVLVQAYSFTSAPIARALVDAKKRGIDVRAVLDKSQKTERYSGADFLANSGVPVLIDSDHAIAHNKVMVIDGDIVITGSFNFTKSAQQKNAENLLVIRDADLVRKYEANWRVHAGHSDPYQGKGQ